MVFVDESNIIKYSFYTVFQKIFCNIFVLCLLLSILYILKIKSLFSFIHDCSERSHFLKLSVLYCYSLLESHNKILLIYIFLFAVFTEIKKHFYWIPPLILGAGIIRYSIDSQKFSKNIVFGFSSFIDLMSIRNIMCDDAILGC